MWPLVLALCTAVMPVAAEPTALSVEEALRLAQQRSQQLVGQQAAAAAAREMAVAAGQRPDPLLRAGIVNVPVDGPERFSLSRDFMTMRTIALMQEFPRAAKRTARAARYEREADAAQAGQALALVNLQRDTALAWLERHFLERMLDLLQAQRAETGLQVEAADAAWRGGRGMQADLFMARSAVAQVDDRIRMTEQQVASATTMLARWVGAAAQRPLGAPPDLAAPPLDAAHLDERLELHPDLALMARREALARAEADIAQSNKRSDWAVELMFSQRGSSYSNMVSINLAIPLQWDQPNRQDRELAARLAIVEQMRAEREELARMHQAETRNWLQQWQSTRDRIAHYERSLIPLAAERTLAAISAYRGGGGMLAAVLEARRMEIETRMERLRLEMEGAALWARLTHLIPPDGHAAAPLARQAAQEQ